MPFARRSSYNSKIASLKSLLSLRGLTAEGSSLSTLEQISLQINALEGDISSARGAIVSEAAMLNEAAELQRRAARSAAELSMMSSNLPAHLPGDTTAPPPVTPASARMPLAETAAGNHHYASSSTPRSATAKHAAPASSTSTEVQPPPPPPPPPPPLAAASSSRPASARAQPPQIALVTEAELGTAPSYMRSRLDVGKVNAAISDVQRLLASKYALLATPSAQVRTMHEVEKRKHSAYKAGETSETKGSFFFSEEDMKSLQHIRNDATGKNLIQLLRHCGRLKEFKHSATGMRCWRALMPNEMR